MYKYRQLQRLIIPNPVQFINYILRNTLPESGGPGPKGLVPCTTNASQLEIIAPAAAMRPSTTSETQRGPAY